VSAGVAQQRGEEQQQRENREQEEVRQLRAARQDLVLINLPQQPDTQLPAT